MHMEKEGAEEFLAISAWYNDCHSSPGNAFDRFEVATRSDVICQILRELRPCGFKKLCGVRDTSAI